MVLQRHRGRLKLLAGFAVLGVLLMLATSAAASHAHIEISIPVDTFVQADEDSTTELATVTVPDGFSGHICDVRAHAENQSSVHPGNDLLVESGNSSVLLSNVEAASGQVIETDDPLELGEVITVSLLMGPDELFSAGLEVVVECLEEETTTTATVAPTDVTTTTADVSPTQETTTTADVSPAAESTSTSIGDEVLAVEVLPFTGSEDLPLGLLALALLALGALVVLSTRRTND
jgi:hypothetical protein